MTKACLEFIVSDYLTRLENLNLFLTLIGEYDRGMMAIDEEDDNEMLWAKITRFCSTKLKHYNITLLNDRSRHLFSIDNCEDESEQYHNRYLYDTDNVDLNDNDYYVYDETSEYWD